MDSRDLQGLMEAYVEVCASVDEAVKGEDSERRKDLAAERRAGIKPLSAKKGKEYADYKMAQMAHSKRKRMGEEVEQIDEISANLALTASQKADEMRRKAAVAGDKETASKKAAQASRLYAGVGPRRAKERKQLNKEDFNYLLKYLVAEGYADTNKAAIAITANMSEEWKQSIVEGVRPGDVETPLNMATYKKRRRSLAGREASAAAKKRGHVDKFTGKPYGTEEAASRRKDIHSPEKAPEREARRKAEEDPD